MSQLYDLSREISQTETLKNNLKQVYELAATEFGYFCENKNSEHAVNRFDEFSKSYLMPFFSSWKVDDISRLDLNSIYSILKRNPYYMACLYFLITFSCIYFLSFFLYSKCTRKIIKQFTKCFVGTKRENEKDGIISPRNEPSKLRNILKYLFLCILLCTLIVTGCFFLNYFFKTRKGIHMNICNVSKTVETLIKSKCPHQTNNNKSCFSVEQVINDAVLVLQKYHFLKKEVEKNYLVDVNNQLPFISEYVRSFNNLSKLKFNLSRNNSMLESKYFHTCPSLIVLVKALNTILHEGNNHFIKTEGTIRQVKKAIKEAFDKIDNTIAQSFKDNFSNIVDKIELASSMIGEFNGTFKSKENINKYTNSVPFAYIVLLIPALIILIGLILYLICIIKGDAVGNNTSIFKLFGLFSAYFGFLTIISLLITSVLMGFSILSGTTCVVTDKVLQKKINIDFINNTILDKCIQNENNTLIDESEINLLLKKIDSFKPDTIENKLKEYEYFFNDIKRKFYENTDKIFDYMWVIIMKKEGNKYYNKIKRNDIKTPLIGIGITKNNFSFGNGDIAGIDSYLNSLNSHIFINENNKLCFEDDTCENDPNKYNITKNSSIDDQKYIHLRDHINVYIRDDIDELVQLFILKAKIRNEQIFDISDLNNGGTKKLTWKEYIPKTNKNTRKNSIIYNYITNIIENINFNEIKKFSNQIKNKFTSAKTLIVETVKSVSKNTRCNKLMKEIRHIRYLFCNKIVLNLAFLSICSFIFSIVSSFLWFFFLFLWLRHKIRTML